MDLREKAPLFPGRCVLPCKACLSFSGSWDLRVLLRSHIPSAGCAYYVPSPGYLVTSPRAGDVILEEMGAWKFLIRKGQGWNGRRGGSGVGGREASLVFSLVGVHRPGLLLGGFVQVTVAIHLPALERLLCSALGPLSPNPQTHSSMCFPPREPLWLKVLLEVLHPGEEQVAQGMEGLTWEAICQRLTFPCWGNQG